MPEINPATTNLEAWWELNEESGNRSDSHGSNTLGDNNNVLFGAGKQGNAADFVRASSQFLDIADNASLSFGNEDFSFGCWFKFDLSGATQAAMGKYDPTSATREYVLRTDASDQVLFTISNDGTATTSITGAVLLTGTWS